MPLESSSSFRRLSHRDDRRRRLLTDDLSNSDEWPVSQTQSQEASQPQRSEHYGDAEFLQRQPRLLDLVPRRRVSLTGMLVATAAIAVGLEASYAWMLDRVTNGSGAVAALNLAAHSSLGGWFCSLLLLTASGAAILVYTVRRHRADDYKGQYRVWRWAAACWFLLATDQAAGLHDAFRDFMIGLTGTPLVGNGTIWWAIPYCFVLGAVGSRLLMDMRPCWLSVSALLVAAIAGGLATAGRLGWVFIADGDRELLVLAGVEMLAHLMLLVAMTLHARYVLLDAEGLLPHRRPRSVEDVATKEAANDPTEPSSSGIERPRKVDPPHPTPPPAFQRTSAPQATTSVSSASAPSPPVSSAADHKLSKAERRALKQRLVQERLQRQRGI